MSNWALLLSIYEGWVLGLGHPAVPVVSVILVILSVLVAVETIYSVSKSKAQIKRAIRLDIIFKTNYNNFQQHIFHLKNCEGNKINPNAFRELPEGARQRQRFMYSSSRSCPPDM